MAVLTEESTRGGAHDRLGALRAAPPVTQRKVRIEVLVGVLLLSVGVVMVLTLRGNTPQQIAIDPVDISSEVPVAAKSPVLLADEALIPLALEAGEFPPDLAPGDAVMVTLRSDEDISIETRSLESTPTVVSVVAPANGDVRWIVVVKGKKTVPKALLAARDVSLSIVSGAGR